MITVAIPVGPHPSNKKWLGQCLDSVFAQTVKPTEVLLIDDMADIGEVKGCNIYRAPWYLGVAHAFNFGVALAKSECVFMLGSDDILGPRCLEACLARYSEVNGYYWVSVNYMSTGHLQDYAPCNAAMVTKSLWKRTKGFPIETAVGNPDTALISMLMVNSRLGKLIHVNTTDVLYYYRDHKDTDTVIRSKWADIGLAVRNLVTDEAHNMLVNV